MLLRFVLVAISALPALISGNQIPVTNGVIGGVPSSNTRNLKTPKRALSKDIPATTPGKLRVVENSGVCGAIILFTTHPLSY
jgi:hypothetical protein